MKRQRGRNRGGGGGQGGGQSGGKPQHNINRAFDSNGPDNIKVRGNAQHVYEKYQALGRDATLAGDRVLAENHLQHAEHYFRTLRAIQPNRAASEIVNRDSFSSGYDIDFEDEAVETAMEEADAQAAARAVDAANAPPAAPMNEADAGAGAVAEGQSQRSDRDLRDRGERREWRDRNDRPQGERFQNDRPQGERQQGDRPQGDRFGGERQQGEFRDRGDRANGDRANGDRPNGERQDRGDRPRFRDRDDRFRDRQDRPEQQPRVEGEQRPPREDRPREERPREERPRDDRPRERFRERDERRPETRGETPATAETSDAPAPALRGDEGSASELPAFLQSAPVAPVGEEGEPRRRPRTRRRREEEGETPAATPEVEEA